MLRCHVLPLLLIVPVSPRCLEHHPPRIERLTFRLVALRVSVMRNYRQKLRNQTHTTRLTVHPILYLKLQRIKWQTPLQTLIHHRRWFPHLLRPVILPSRLQHHPLRCERLKFRAVVLRVSLMQLSSQAHYYNPDSFHAPCHHPIPFSELQHIKQQT